jgi:hypothetical protein
LAIQALAVILPMILVHSTAAVLSMELQVSMPHVLGLLLSEMSCQGSFSYYLLFSPVVGARGL